ncbi:MAG: hypothetical protein AABW72_01795 [archaeon]
MPNLRRFFSGKKPKSLPSGVSKKDRQRYKSLKGRRIPKRPSVGGAKLEKGLSLATRTKLLAPKIEEFLRGKTKGRNLLYADTLSWSLRRVLFTIFETVGEGLPREVFDRSLPEIFAQAVRQKGIRSIAEVGAGETGILTEANDLLGKSRVKRYSVGGMSDREKSACRRLGIEVIPEYAGDLSRRHKGKCDLIVASNVFSFGGSDAGVGSNSMNRAFLQNTKAVVDLIKTLSNNPNARIVLTEAEDCLLLARKEIERYARVERWQQTDMPNARYIRDPFFIELNARKAGGPALARKMKEAPNIVVLAPPRKIQ